MRLVDIIMDFSPIPKDRIFREMKEGDDLLSKKIDWLDDLLEFVRGICPDFEILNEFVDGMKEYDEDNEVQEPLTNQVLGDELVSESEFIRIQITSSEDSLGRHTWELDEMLEEWLRKRFPEVKVTLTMNSYDHLD